MRAYVFHQHAAAGKLRAIERMFSLGTSPGQRDARLRTPLHTAALANKPQAIALLIRRYPAALSMLDKDQRTPLHVAVAAEHLEATTEILKHVPPGQCLQRDRYSRTALMDAVCARHLKIVEAMFFAIAPFASPACNGTQVNS